jgi:ABC-type branched-subunit amino acid transport system substrate-binding protein
MLVAMGVGVSAQDKTSVTTNPGPCVAESPSAGLVNDWLREESQPFERWDLGGQIRTRFEDKSYSAVADENAADFQRNGVSGNRYVLLRERARLGYTPCAWFQLYSEMQDAGAYNDDRNPSPDTDHYGLRQAWAGLGNPEAFPLTLKAGRAQTIGAVRKAHRIPRVRRRACFCSWLAAFMLMTGAPRSLAGQMAAAVSTNTFIGLLLPPEEPEAASVREGVQLGIDDANESAGMRFNLIVRGRVGQWGADAVEAARMVTDDGVRGLIAPGDGGATHLALQVAGRTATPVISLCGDSSVSATGVPWMARVAPRTVEEAQALLSTAGGGKQAVPLRWTALVPDDRPGREITRDLKAAAATNHCRLEDVVEVKLPLARAASAASSILSRHPDAILVWLDPASAGALVKALRGAGFSGKLGGPGRLCSAAFTEAAGVAANGFLVPAIVCDREAEAAAAHFRTAFRERFGRKPDAKAALSYDAAGLLIHILRQVGDQPARQAFPLLSIFPGASGMLAFDSEGNRKVALRILEVENGHFVPLPITNSQ